MKWEIVVVVPLRKWKCLEKKKIIQICILVWYEIIKLSRVVHMCTNSSISAATRTQIFGHPGLNGLCLYYRKSTKIPHVSLLCRKGIGQMDFFGCIFCVQILTYICRSIFPKRKNERRIWHYLSKPVKKSNRKKIFSSSFDYNYYLLSYQTNFFKKPEKEG